MKNINRRDLIKSGISAGIASMLPAYGQTDNKRLPTRIPLHEFEKDPALVAALRKGVAEMKRRLPSDPLSWFYQAAIHGVTDDAIKSAAQLDPNVANVDQKRYWNQCPHGPEQNSADFLPWHRAYTHYFEKILRFHTGMADFALPYWDYSDKSRRKFPEIFGREHLNHNIEDNSPDNINPLFHAQRDNYLTSFEHPFAKNLPYLELSDSAVDSSAAMASTEFFGQTENEGLGGGIGDSDTKTRGLLESSPHDPIHRVVGGIIPDAFDSDLNPIGFAVGAMASPPTAGFDPIFCVHHSNIDRLWAEWSLAAGKSWGKLPPRTWFAERKWFFFDLDASAGFAVPIEKNEPRISYFDYRKLGIRFQSEDLAKNPLALPDPIPDAAPPEPKTPTLLASLEDRQLISPISIEAVQIPASRLETFRGVLDKAANSPLVAGLSRPRFVVKLKNVQLGFVRATGFDVHLVAKNEKNPAALDRAKPSFIGSVSLFNHTHSPDEHVNHGHDHAEDKHDGHLNQDQSFDATRAVEKLGDGAEDFQILIVPYSLAVRIGGNEIFDPTPLKFDGVDLLILQ